MSRLQPIGQKRLTNICIVRLKRGGKRFEVAAYRNTVIAWRNKVEKDIDEVLQVHTIYSNLDKGILANREDMIEAFGTDNEDAVCVEVLNRGEFQVSEEERQMMVDTLFKDVASRVTDMCVDPETQLPYPLTTIERAMRETLHFTPATNRSAKMQALQVIRQLESVNVLPIVRAKMHLRLVVPADKAEAALEAVRALAADERSSERLVIGSTEVTTSATSSSSLSTTACHADPGLFRGISELAREHGGSVQVIELKASSADQPPTLGATSAMSAAELADGLPRAPAPPSLEVGSGPPPPPPPVPPPPNPAAAAAAGGGGSSAASAGSERSSGGSSARPSAADASAKRAERMFRLNLRNAEKGDPVAQLEVGKAYADGVGVETDAAQGRHWLEQAAQQGVNAATQRLQGLSL